MLIDTKLCESAVAPSPSSPVCVSPISESWALPGPSPGEAFGRKGPCILKRLGSRPRDLVYVAFFLMQIPGTIILDLQAVCPSWVVIPERAKYLADLYMSVTNDPIVGSVGGYFGEGVQRQFVWLWWFMCIEVFFQLPTFFYAAYNLYFNTNPSRLYPLLVAYGVSTAMSTLPCLTVILTTPSPPGASSNTAQFRSVALNPSESGALTPGLTSTQRYLLLGSYLPLFVLPLLIAIDMACRVQKLAHVGWVIKRSKID